MSLQEIALQCEYRSDKTNTVTDFYIPCLSASCEYWRAVGYFSSQGLSLAGKGLVTFIRNTGKMRLVASPVLTEDDVVAIQRGYDQREVILEKAIVRQLEGNLAEIVLYPLECLAWLISEERLDIKIAMPLRLSADNPSAIYHEKIGVFTDAEGNSVAFTGSQNETFGGLVSNFESIDVYWAWDDPHERVQRKIDNFTRLWNNATSGLSVVDFPAAAKHKLLEFKPDSLPDFAAATCSDNLVINDSGMTYSYQQRTIDIPDDLRLRDYQQEAIDAWFENDCRGFLEMATGTGKTITALSAVVRLVRERQRLFILVTCPFKHLVRQWADEARQFGLQPILAYQSQLSWTNLLNEAVIDYNYGRTVCVITTHATFGSDRMQRTIARLNGDGVIIADEAHHLGAEESRERLPHGFNYRLGLSATPNRWFDSEGTEVLSAYFGETVYEFPLSQAIEAGYLCPYSYHPHLVELTNSELDEYENLTTRIARLFSQYQDDDETDGALGALLRQRTDLLNRARNKLPALRELVRNESESLHHALFYCAPGQIDEVTPMLGYDLGLRVHRFTAEESTEERQSLLSRFASRDLQGLVAMRCLDEGVDVPDTQSAYILASSSNPREFIQRRGRILRLAPGKTEAKIHDLLAVPSLDAEANRNSPVYEVERRILRRELKRFHEFARTARNRHRAINEIWHVARVYNLMGIFGDSND